MKKRLFAPVAAVLISTTALLVLICLLGSADPGVSSPALAAPVDADPAVTGVDPVFVINDHDTPIVITGTDFAAVLSGTQVITPPTMLLDSTALPDVGWVSSTTLTSTVPSGFPVGVYTVTVANPDGGSGSLPSGLMVQYPAPTLQGVAPISGTYGQATMLTITGTGFVTTPTVVLGETPCPAVGYVSSTTLTATVPEVLLPAVYDLTVTNPGPGDPQDILADAFTLYSPTPTVTAIAPDSAPNDLDTQVVITGTGFAPTPTVALGTIPLQNVTWVSLTQLTALVPWGMDVDTYNLTVTNPSPGAASDMLSDAFTATQGIGVWNAGELYGGSVEHVVINPVTPTTVYATSDLVGMFRSRDAAGSWAIKYASTHMGYLAIDPFSPNRIYMEAYGHAGGNIFRSDDEGETWVPITTTFPTTPPPSDDCWGGFGIYTPRSTPGTVYAHGCDAGDGRSGLIKSTNWGQDWEPAIDGLTDTQVTALAFHPDDPDIMYLGTAGGHVYRSFDGGGWWHYASSPLGYVATMAVNPFGNHEVWVSSLSAFGDPCALLKSANAGLTAWTALEPDPGQQVCAMSIDFAPTISGTVFIAGMKGYKTTDGGATWEPFGPPDVSIIQDIALHPIDPGIIYVGDLDFGVHRTADGGATWEMASQGLTAVVPRQLQTVLGQPDIVYASVGSGHIYRGTRGGGIWQALPISGTSFLVDPISPTRAYAGLYDYICASTDGGDTWPTCVELVPLPRYASCLQVPLALLAVPGQPGTVLAGMQHWCGSWPSPGSIYRSTDYGLHWDPVYPTATHEISQVNDLAYDPVSPTVVYAATGEAGHGGGVFTSTDGGANWEPVGVGVIDWALDVAVEPGTHRVFVSGGGLPLYVSDNGGEAWTPTGLGEGSNVYDILFAPGVAPGDFPVLYDAAAQGLYRSTDGAQSWQRAAGVLGQVPVYALAVVTDTDRVILYAGTTGGYVESGAAQGLTMANGDGVLVSAGVYRYTTRRTWELYLPLVFKAYTP